MAALLAALFALAALPAGAQVRWYERLEEGVAVRNATRKPALVFFYNGVARDCQRMREETFAAPGLQELMDNFVCFELDARAHAALVERYGIFKVPTVLFLDPRGTEVDRAVGFKPPDVFSLYLDRTNRASLGGAPRTESTQDAATRRHIERLAEIQPFKTATVNILQPRPGTLAITLSHKAPAASELSVVGDFNDWRIGATPMQRAVNGDWYVTINVSEDVYEYKYVDDAGEYHEDLRNPLKKPNPYGTSNSVLVIGNPMTSPLILGDSVTFIVYRPNAREVAVAGSFNDWQPTPMFRKRDNPALWGFRCNLPAGTYQYKYVIDGEWIVDPENYHVHTDAGGNVNSLLAVR